VVGQSVCLFVGHDREPCKTAEPIEMPFGGWLMWAQGTTYSMGSSSDKSIRCCDGWRAAMRPFVKTLSPLVILFDSASSVRSFKFLTGYHKAVTISGATI